MTGAPQFADRAELIGDLLRCFTLPNLLSSCRLGSVPLILGRRRASTRFPTVHRFSVRRLLAWEGETSVEMEADEALAATFDPACRHLAPYLVLPTGAFTGEIAQAIRAIESRLGIEGPMALLWIGSGGHITPLHHDGDLVAERWHLVVQGAKRFDLLPPNAPALAAMPWWSLHNRFGATGCAPLPDATFEDPEGAQCYFLAAGQMLQWPRRWWHRVEIAPQGTTISLSMRAQRSAGSPWDKARHRLRAAIVGDAEVALERATVERPHLSLRALRDLTS